MTTQDWPGEDDRRRPPQGPDGQRRRQPPPGADGAARPRRQPPGDPTRRASEPPRRVAGDPARRQADQRRSPDQSRQPRPAQQYSADQQGSRTERMNSPRPRPRSGQAGTPPRGTERMNVPHRTPPRGTGRPAQPPRDPRRPVVADQPTEVFAAVEAGGTATAVKEKPAPAPLGKGGVAIRTAGEVLITLGLVVLLFMVYEVYVTDLFSAEKQSAASDQLQGDWAKDRTLHPGLVDGKAFARIHIPAFGADFNFTIQEGTGEDSLAIGPGHYKGTALPGEPGNFGVAGHRVGKGAPFNDLDNLSSCDQIVIETQTDFFIYKVLPYDDELSGWSSGKGAQPECKGVGTLRNPSIPGGGAYDQTFGRKVVLPSQGDAVNPVPYKPADTLPKAEEASLLTLTTCHPQFSAKQRLIITSVLTQQVPKSQVADYGKLLTQIGGAS